jgi:hypothetical protein
VCGVEIHQGDRHDAYVNPYGWYGWAVRCGDCFDAWTRRRAASRDKYGAGSSLIQSKDVNNTAGTTEQA